MTNDAAPAQLPDEFLRDEGFVYRPCHIGRCACGVEPDVLDRADASGGRWPEGVPTPAQLPRRRNWFRIERGPESAMMPVMWHAVERQTPSPYGPMVSFCGVEERPRSGLRVITIEYGLMPFKWGDHPTCPRCEQALAQSGGAGEA